MKGTAAIVGAGIAGLAAARSLVQAGWDVEVHERQPSLSTSGTALGVWPTAHAALERIGATATLTTLELVHGELRRPDGRVLTALSLPPGTVGVGRMNLVESLLASLPEGTVHWQSPVDSPADVAALASRADVLVAADGVHSAVRAASFPEARLRDGGTVAFRGIAPLETAGGAETWGAGLLAGRSPFPGGGTNWYFGVRSDLAGPRDADPLERLRTLYRDWHSEVQEVLAVLTPEMIDRRRIEDMAPLPSYVSGNIALAGDAAHAMSPHLGRGGCESLVDGLALAEALRDESNVTAALARYDATRRRPSQKAVTGSRIMSRLVNQQRHPWWRDGLVVAAGRIASLRSRPAPIPERTAP